MLWRDFEPYVMPFVSGCPLPVLEHHARLVAMDFCRRTLCFTRTLEPLMAMAADIEMEPPRHTQIVKVKAVAVDGKEVALASHGRGNALLRSGHTGDLAFTEDNRTLFVYPVVPRAQVVVDAALAPTLTATGLDDLIAGEYAQDMAHGIIAAIQRIPKQDFTDMAASAVSEQLYRSRITTVAAKIARGQVGAKMPAYTTFL